MRKHSISRFVWEAFNNRVLGIFDGPRVRFNSYMDRKHGVITKIEHEMRRVYLTKKQQFGVEFYQSYPPLNISGARPTLSRINNYGLKKYLKKGQAILDIGGNTGFFSLYISSLVRHIDVVEKNETLVKVGNMLKHHQKIKNVDFFRIDYKEFKPRRKYDIVFSFAVHRWVRTDFATYLKSIGSKMKKNGLLLIEGHTEENFDKKIQKVRKEFSVVEKGITDDDGLIRSYYYLKKKY